MTRYFVSLRKGLKRVAYFCPKFSYICIIVKKKQHFAIFIKYQQSFSDKGIDVSYLVPSHRLLMPCHRAFGSVSGRTLMIDSMSLMLSNYWDKSIYYL